jgi:hypothetical protein
MLQMYRARPLISAFPIANALRKHVGVALHTVAITSLPRDNHVSDSKVPACAVT